MSAYKFVLLVMLIPCTIRWLSGRAGPIRQADICVVLICVWSSLSLLINNGLGKIEACGMIFIETMGSYFLARCYVKSVEQFIALSKLLFLIIVIMLPFLIFENMTGINLILKAYHSVGPALGQNLMPGRLGLNRAQGPFEHAILLGVFCGSTIGIVYYVLGYEKSSFNKLLACGAVGLAAFTSLSSGPLSGSFVQIGLIAWDNLFKHVRDRWKILIIIAILAYVAVDILSNRTPFEVLISRFALNAETGYGRVRIWHWGWVNVWQHPVIGLGDHDWQRGWGMTESFDMFWLYSAVFFGLPAFIFQIYLFFWTFLKISNKKIADRSMRSLRMGQLVSMSGFFICGWMVHFWGALYVDLMFMIGSGIWILNYQDRPPEAVVERARTKRRTVF